MRNAKNEIISINTAYGTIPRVPVIQWTALKPYWESIVEAMAEVIMENKFHPYPASYARPGGIVASNQYWESYKRFNSTSVIYDAKRFLELLKQKNGFCVSVRSFNKGSGADWLSPDNTHLLGSRMYGFYYTLKPIFKEVKESDGTWLRIKLKPF